MKIKNFSVLLQQKYANAAYFGGFSLFASGAMYKQHRRTKPRHTLFLLYTDKTDHFLMIFEALSTFSFALFGSQENRVGIQTTLPMVLIIEAPFGTSIFQFFLLFYLVLANVKSQK